MPFIVSLVYTRFVKLQQCFSGAGCEATLQQCFSGAGCDATLQQCFSCAGCDATLQQCLIHKLLFEHYVCRSGMLFVQYTHFIRLRSGGEQLPNSLDRNASSGCVFRSSYNITALINICGARSSSSFCACCG